MISWERSISVCCTITVLSSKMFSTEKLCKQFLEQHRWSWICASISTVSNIFLCFFGSSDIFCLFCGREVLRLLLIRNKSVRNWFGVAISGTEGTSAKAVKFPTEPDGVSNIVARMLSKFGSAEASGMVVGGDWAESEKISSRCSKKKVVGEVVWSTWASSPNLQVM